MLMTLIYMAENLAIMKICFHFKDDNIKTAPGIT